VHAQSLSLFDVDASNFPTMKAKFYAFDAAGKQVRPSAGELSLTESGQLRTIINVTCPPPPPPVAISSVLTVDVSGSMSGGSGGTANINLAKAAAKAWIQGLPAGLSECALTSFDNANYLNQDFTTDRTRLQNALSTLSPSGGTNYDMGLLQPLAGSLQISQRGKYKRVVVFLSDGLPNSEPNTATIIAEAKKQNCMVFAVTLGLSCPQSLKDITSQTGGQWYENVTTTPEAEDVYRKIMQVAMGSDPCELTWMSEAACEARNTTVQLQWQTRTATSSYTPPPSTNVSLKVVPNFVAFGKRLPSTQHDTTITLTAQNADFTVTGISRKYGSAEFTVVNTTFPLSIPKSTSKTITLRFAPSDSSIKYASFEIVTDKCTSYFSANAGFPSKQATASTLKLTKPNGGEVFAVGSDTLITWEGIAPTDTVSLEFSADNGSTWQLLTTKATGLKYIWKNVPKPPSAKCLVRVKQGGKVPSGASPSIEWQKSFGGSSDDWAHSIQQSADGGYIVAGKSESNDGDVTGNHGITDYWVVKLSPQGTVVWQKSLGGGRNDLAYSIQQSADGGYIVAGWSGSNDGDVMGNHGNEDYWVVKLSPQGTIEWQKSLGGSRSDNAYSIQQSADGGYIVAGGSASTDGDVTGNHGGTDYWVVKLSPQGTIEWQKSLGGSRGDYANSIQQCSDGGYIVAGNSESNDGDVTGNHGREDYWVVKLSHTGALEWQKSLGGNKQDWANSIQQSTDGGYIVAGYSESNDGDVTGNHGNYDYWVVKLSPTGAVEWQKSLGGSSNDAASSIQQSTDGGYIVAGVSSLNDGDITGNHGGADSWVVKLSTSGTIEWQKSLGGSRDDWAYSIQQSVDGGYIMAGYSKSNDGDVIGNHGNMDYWVVKLSPDGVVLQSDTSDAVFSIVAPLPKSADVDMLQCLVGNVKDSLVTTFVQNAGTFPFRVDSIQIVGADASQFSVVSGIPPFDVQAGGNHAVEFRFRPSSIGVKTAQLLIFTQADTLRQTIRGEGIAPALAVVNSLIDFGRILVGEKKDTLQTLTIKNIGTAPLTITATRHAGPNDLDFSTLSGGGSFVLQADETAKLDLRFTATELGRTSGRLLFDYNGVGAPATVQLFAEGVLPDTARTTVSIKDIEAEAGTKTNVVLHFSKKEKMSVVGAPTDWYARIHYNKSILFTENTSNICTGTTDSCVLELTGVYNPKTEELISIPCITTLGNTDHSTIVIDTFFWKNSAIVTEVATQNGTITLNGVCEDGGVRLFIPATTSTSLSTRPNPAQDNLQIHYGLREPLTVTLELLTMTGQVAQTILTTQSQVAGQYTLTTNLSLLGNGVYLLRLRTNKEMLTTRVDVVK